jgi:hypothetical protein
MPLDLERFSKLRPFLYHLTGRGNIPYIQEDMELKPSNTLYAASGENDFRGTRRRGPRMLKSGRQVRDQDPLHPGNISFSGGWTFADLILHLDDHVFFWPGWERGPIQSGKNHFERYAAERPTILRVATTELFRGNRDIPPLFCKYNSGAPRCTYGKGSPRGPQTFLPATEFPFLATDVKEVTFRSSVKLPSSVQATSYPNDSWQPLKTISLDDL